jgi:hypothetical protein
LPVTSVLSLDLGKNRLMDGGVAAILAGAVGIVGTELGGPAAFCGAKIGGGTERCCPSATGKSSNGSRTLSWDSWTAGSRLQRPTQ